ncbi:IclR family transcriptional regulator [Rhodococcus erythropolis]|uniref:IclR family transcriptional regulator n=1 Tax=Rhodococcus erythropolis TaxID=1833 RepID=UPI00210D6BF9|nr:IclR family transcriptional regulator [Rhodococcus erythropolis]MCQ4129032.1 IclR family transcriptional regulator [Rhodococcus erythropolis]
MTSTRSDADPVDQRQSGGAPAGTQTLIRGLRVVEAVAAQNQPIGVGDLSRQLDLPKSTVQRLLRTLQQEGWAETSHDPVTRWQLSPHLLAMARRNAPSQSLRDVAIPYLKELGERSGETIHFSVPDGDTQLVLIERVDSIHPVRTFNPVGAGTAFHTSASGKAWLAMLPDDEVEVLLARPLAKPTANSIVDPKNLLHQIHEARERGYAVNISENRAHVCALGAVVLGSFGRPVAAVAISMPDIRFEPARVPEWGRWVRQTAQSIGDVLAG